jgi:3D (Asp-Asp-Asp) domain-containing protein
LFASKNPAAVKSCPPLQSGVRYEVRKALATTVPFRPKELKGYTFVLDTPKPAFEKPPLMLASASRLGPSMRVRTTAYTHSESDHLVYGVKNAIGTNLKYGMVRSAAADWSRFPVGTRFCIASEPGIVYEVDDYGSALVGTGTIDLYKPSQSMMNHWGVRHVDIEVIQWGSFERSVQIMRDRTQWKHVRAMMEGIEARLRTAGLPEGADAIKTASL